MDAGPWGGSEELWFHSARRWAAQGHPVTAAVVAQPSPASQLDRLRREGVRIVEYGAPSAAMRVLYRPLPQLRYRWLTSLQAPRALLSCGSNWSVRAAEITELWRSRGTPYAIVAHSASPWYWPSDSVAARMRAAYRGARASFFVSEANLAITRDQIGDAIPNASVIRNPFALDYAEPLPWPAEGEGLRLACVARLDPGIKGHDLLIAALAQPVWRDRPVTLTIFGDGDRAELTRSLIERHGVSRTVRLGGHGSPRDIWRDHHALVLMSRTEAMPIVVIEAMLAGRPCFVTDVGGLTEVVTEGVSGFVATAPTAAAVGQALERAWERRADWQSMGKYAAERIRRLVPPDPVGDFLALFDAVFAA